MDHQIYDYLHPDARFIRKMVFMEEQGFQNEFDDIDEMAHHVVIYSQNNPVATCRYYLKDGKYYIGRICVLIEYRGAHLGSKLLDLAIAALKEETDEVYLSAQVRAQPFYERNGFIAFGDPYDDEGVPHIQMKKAIR